MFSARLLAEAASLESTNVLELAKAFCMNRPPGGDFVGSGGGGIDVDVLGLVAIWLGVGKAFSASLLE